MKLNPFRRRKSEKSIESQLSTRLDLAQLKRNLVRALLLTGVVGLGSLYATEDELVDKILDRVPIQFIGTFATLIIFDTAKNVRDTLRWRRREDHEKFQVSMSSVHDEKLIMSKLGEGQMADFIRDERIRSILIKHQKETTDDDALVRFPEEVRDKVERALKTVITKILEKPQDAIDIHTGKASAEMVEFWATFTFERYGIHRNLIPRLILVPAENLMDSNLQGQINADGGQEKMAHRNLRINTHQTMVTDIQREDGPQACFKVSITRAKYE